MLWDAMGVYGEELPQNGSKLRAEVAGISTTCSYMGQEPVRVPALPKGFSKRV